MSQLWDVSPFFVGDGKEDIGPLLRHIKHLDELDRKKDDENVLKQDYDLNSQGREQL